MPSAKGGHLLSGTSKFDGDNLEDAIAHAKCCFMLEWPTSKVEVVPYGIGFSNQNVQIRKINISKLLPNQ